tara:strand:- start:1339 stop:1569 length:231 start_codon:yes stop_codon:yes gene_type:complete
MWLSNKNLKSDETCGNIIVIEDSVGNIVCRIDNNNKRHYYNKTPMEKMKYQIQLLKAGLTISLAIALLAIASLLVS